MSGSHTLTATAEIGPGYKVLEVCARYGQILAVTLIGCRKRRKLEALIPRVVVFVNDPSSVERRIDFAVFFIVLWSYDRKICLMCHENSENSCDCSYLLRICFCSNMKY